MAATQERDYYNEARLLIRNAKTATLATAEAGLPHAALVTVTYLADLSPILLLSQLAIHTRQLQANPACALLLSGAGQQRQPADYATHLPVRHRRSKRMIRRLARFS